MSSVNVACIQMNSSADIEENLKQAGTMIREAAKEGAEFIATPENTDFISKGAGDTKNLALSADKHPGIPFFSFLAKELKVWILVGSLKIKTADDKIVNRSFLFGNSGQLKASYDKMHMFDVDLPDGEKHKESDSFEAGSSAVIVGTPWQKLGMSICYDVRFPYLYRDMAQKGAELMAIPSAFTEQTGKAHWEVLLRARAIETGSFVIAPAQVGDHAGGRKTYGHSMIVGPWGQVLAEQKEDTPGYIMRKIDFLDVTKARAAIPSLQHDRKYDYSQSKETLK